MDLVLCLQYYNFVFFLFSLFPFPLPMVYHPVYITVYSYVLECLKKNK